MKIVIPMAGLGKRMRPHTLATPKPLLKVAGKPIVELLVETLARSTSEKIEEVSFVISPSFDKSVNAELIKIAESIGAKGSVYYQEEALGTAHAVYCAKDSISGPLIVAFADTLFHGNVKISENQEAVIWVRSVDDPSQFGVVLSEGKKITGFVEKPSTPISDLAIIGIYYFKDGDNLKNEIKTLIDNKIIKNGEYQLTDVLQNMLDKNIVFENEQVDEWLDCGNKDATVNTNKLILEYNSKKQLVSGSAILDNSIIIPPCFIGDNVVLKNSVIGPHVSIGNFTKVENSIITNSIVEENCSLLNVNIDNSMIGKHVVYAENYKELSIADFTTIK